MKKVKEFSVSYVFLSFLYVAIGIVLVIWPSMSIQMIGRGLGVIMLVVGATYGVIYFTRDKRQEGYLQMELVIGIICLALGVFILLTPDFMRMVLPFAMATVLLVGAIVKIQTAVSMKRLFIRKWFLGLIGALIIIGLGIFLLVFPFTEDWHMLLYIGICLILDGLTNLAGLLCIRIRTGKLNRMQKKNPGADVQTLIEQEWASADAAKAEKKAQKQEKKRQKSQEIVVESETVDPDSHDDDTRRENSTVVARYSGAGAKESTGAAAQDVSGQEAPSDPGASSDPDKASADKALADPGISESQSTPESTVSGFQSTPESTASDSQSTPENTSSASWSASGSQGASEDADSGDRRPVKRRTLSLGSSRAAVPDDKKNESADGDSGKGKA